MWFICSQSTEYGTNCRSSNRGVIRLLLSLVKRNIWVEFVPKIFMDRATISIKTQRSSQVRLPFYYMSTSTSHADEISLQELLVGQTANRGWITCSCSRGNETETFPLNTRGIMIRWTALSFGLVVKLCQWDCEAPLSNQLDGVSTSTSSQTTLCIWPIYNDRHNHKLFIYPGIFVSIYDALMRQGM